MSVTTSAQQILGDASAEAHDEIPEKFWELIERYRGELVNQAFAILGNIQDSEDVVQESFCEALSDRYTLGKVRSLGAWFRKINRANALDRLRHRRRQANKAGDSQREMPRRMVTTGGFSVLETRELMAKAVEKLPRKMRSVVTLKYWEGLSYEQIAQHLGLPKSTVWRIYYDASQIIYGEIGGLFEAPQSTLAESPASSTKGEQQ